MKSDAPPVKYGYVLTEHITTSLRGITTTLHDGSYDYEFQMQRLDAAIASGEYFETLATLLDSLPNHPELEQIVRDLLYLQKSYQISKKDAL